MRSVTPDYFELLGMTIAQGRPFLDSDTEDAPDVVVVDQALADRYFPGEQAVGRNIWFGGRDPPASRVVGVVTNARTESLTQEAVPEIYVSYALRTRSYAIRLPEVRQTDRLAHG